MLLKKTSTAISEQIAKAKIDEELDAEDNKDEDEEEQDGDLYEKTAEEDEELREADMSTYTKIMNESGGLWFWIPFSGLLAFKVFLWDTDSSFWVRFADTSPEEQTEKASSFMMQALGLMLCNMAFDTFISRTHQKTAKEFRRIFFKNVLDKMLHAPINLYHDVTPSSRVLGYIHGDINCCDEGFFHQCGSYVSDKMMLVFMVVQIVWNIPQILPCIVYFAYISYWNDKFYTPFQEC